MPSLTLGLKGYRSYSC